MPNINAEIIKLFLVLVIVFLVLVFTETLWRVGLLKNEQSRKLVHILVGVFAASWGFLLSPWQIVLLSLLMFGVVLVSKYAGIFKSIHSVKRKTWGELFFPLGIAVCALLASNPWVFMAAILHVSLADGLAGVMGSMHIKTSGYKILGHQKTLMGTYVFFLVSLVITLLVFVLSDEVQGSITMLLLVPLVATFIENISPYGTDDMMVPLFVMVMLNAVS